MESDTKLNGIFLISLDFELHWGPFERYPQDYVSFFRSTREGILRTLELFREYEIHATWATVGMLFSSTKEELVEFTPSLKPNYTQPNLSSYNIFDQVGNSEEEDPSHFAKSLIEQIKKTPNQEVGSHTFSHYFACEEGQDLEAFEADYMAAENIARKNKIELRSLVFPRNQVNFRYLPFLASRNVLTIRSNPKAWFYDFSQSSEKFNSLKYRLMRACDLVLPISNTLFERGKVEENVPLMIPASRFLRPYKKRDYFLNTLKLKRVKNEMLSAAKSQRNYHLWWHPHNFGHELDANIKYLKSILEHYNFLKEKYGFQSLSMCEFYEYCK